MIDKQQKCLPSTDSRLHNTQDHMSSFLSHRLEGFNSTHQISLRWHWNHSPGTRWWLGGCWLGAHKVDWCLVPPKLSDEGPPDPWMVSVLQEKQNNSLYEYNKHFNNIEMSFEFLPLVLLGQINLYTPTPSLPPKKTSTKQTFSR